MAHKTVYFAFLAVFFLAAFTDASSAADITLVKECADRYPVPSSSHSCGYGGIIFTINNETTDGISNCTLSSGNFTEFWVAANTPHLFVLPPTAPAGTNKIRCNVTSSRFVERQFEVYGALLDAKVDVPSAVYANSTVSLKVTDIDYDLPDAAGGFSACWNFRDPSTGQVVAQWACSNSTTLYGVPPSLPAGPSQFVLLLQARNYENLFKYVPVTVKNAPSFSSSIYPESRIVPSSGGRLEYTVSVRALVLPVDVTAGWSDGRMTVNGQASSVALHVDAGKTGSLNLAFVVGAMDCESECPQQQFSIILTDQWGNSQQLTGRVVVTDRYRSSYSVSPESIGSVVVQQGGEARAEVAVANTGRIPDAYSAVLLGEPAPYSRVTPEMVELAAGGVGRFTVTISGSSGLSPGSLRICFSSKNQPLDQKCSNASITTGAPESLLSLDVQPRTLMLSEGEPGKIDVTVSSASADTVFSGSLESDGCADWLNNTEWLSAQRKVSGRYTNWIQVRPTRSDRCQLKITVGSEGVTKTATVDVISSLPQSEVENLDYVADALSINLTVLRSKADILRRAGVLEEFVSGVEKKANDMADTCREDVANEKYQQAGSSCPLAVSAVRSAMDAFDYGGQSIRASKPVSISPLSIASAILVALAVGYMIVSAPPPSF